MIDGDRSIFGGEEGNLKRKRARPKYSSNRPVFGGAESLREGAIPTPLSATESLERGCHPVSRPFPKNFLWCKKFLSDRTAFLIIIIIEGGAGAPGTGPQDYRDLEAFLNSSLVSCRSPHTRCRRGLGSDLLTSVSLSFHKTTTPHSSSIGESGF